MGEFMEQLQGQIAGRLNDHRVRSGPVFPERYDDQALLDAPTLRDKISYVLNNPVKDQLVETAEDWPGVTSMRHHYAGDSTLEGRWLNHTEWRKYRRRKDDYERSVAMEDHTVDLHYPAALEGESPEERRRSLIELIEDERDRLHRQWSTSPHRGEAVLGAEAVLEEFDWTHIPSEPLSTGPSPVGVASDEETAETYRQKRCRISKHYRRVSSQWPDCTRDDFPDGTYPPTSKHCVGSPTAG